MNDYIDISVLKGQQIVINKFAEFYLIEELEQIKFDNIVIPDSEKETTTIYEKSFETDHKLQILDIILADTRYIDIRMSKDKSIQTDIKCTYNDQIVNNLFIIQAYSINFIKYRDPYDTMLNMHNIANNYAIKLMHLDRQWIKHLDELKFITDYVSTNEEILTNDAIYKRLPVGNCVYELKILNKKIFRLCAYNLDTNLKEYLLLKRDKVGLSTICLIFDKIVQLKRLYN
jgi:hypothetical protein